MRSKIIKNFARYITPKKNSSKPRHSQSIVNLNEHKFYFHKNLEKLKEIVPKANQPKLGISKAHDIAVKGKLAGELTDVKK
jgi:uncharacterized protein YjaG (DUF416 family)